MNSRKRGLLSGGAKNPKPKPSTSFHTTQLTEQGRIKAQFNKVPELNRSDSPDLFNDSHDDEIQILEPTPKKRQVNKRLTQNIEDNNANANRRHDSQATTSKALTFAPPTQPLQLNETASSKTGSTNKRRQIFDNEVESQSFQTVKRTKLSSLSQDGNDESMTIRSAPPTKTFRKASQGSHCDSLPTQKILCSQMSTWSISQAL